MKRRLWLVLIVWLGLAAPAWASDPLEQTRATLERAGTIIASEQTHNQKLAALSALFRNFLDTDSMGRAALGQHWASFTPPQQKEFLGLFREMLDRTYVQKLLLFDKPDFAYVAETRQDGQARVDTKIVTPRDAFVVVYRLRSDGDRWLATKITVEDVNLTDNLGSQLDRLLSRMSVDDLLDLMRTKYGGDRSEAAR